MPTQDNIFSEIRLKSGCIKTLLLVAIWRDYCGP